MTGGFMRLSTRATTVFSVVVLASRLAVASCPAAGATLSLNLQGHSVQCNELIGTITFAAPVVNEGTAQTSATWRIQSHDCEILDDNTGFYLKGFTGSGTISASTDCATLFGLSSPLTGSIVLHWSAISGEKISGPTTSTLTLPGGVWGGVAFDNSGGTAPEENIDSWGGAYSFLAFGDAASDLPLGAVQSYTGPEAVSGAFQGPDGGATSMLQAAFNQSYVTTASECIGAGVRKLTFGIGGLTLK
jgi:hypothetical protein